jgi:hypothetical protein
VPIQTHNQHSINAADLAAAPGVSLGTLLEAEEAGGNGEQARESSPRDPRDETRRPSLGAGGGAAGIVRRLGGGQAMSDAIGTSTSTPTHGTAAAVMTPSSATINSNLMTNNGAIGGDDGRGATDPHGGGLALQQHQQRYMQKPTVDYDGLSWPSMFFLILFPMSKFSGTLVCAGAGLILFNPTLIHDSWPSLYLPFWCGHQNLVGSGIHVPNIARIQGDNTRGNFAWRTFQSGILLSLMSFQLSVP